MRILHKYSARTSQRTQCASIRKIKRQRLHIEITAVCYTNHKAHIPTQLADKPYVYTVTDRF